MGLEISCVKGDEINLVDCYHLGLGNHNSGEATNHCVAIECSDDCKNFYIKFVNL